MYEQIVEEGFKRGVEYEITNIKKKNLRVGGGLLTRASQKDEGAKNYLKQRGTRGQARGSLPCNGRRHRQEECTNSNREKP